MSRCKRNENPIQNGKYSSVYTKQFLRNQGSVKIKINNNHEFFTYAIDQPPPANQIYQTANPIAFSFIHASPSNITS